MAIPQVAQDRNATERFIGIQTLDRYTRHLHSAQQARQHGELVHRRLDKYHRQRQPDIALHEVGSGAAVEAGGASPRLHTTDPIVRLVRRSSREKTTVWIQ